MANGFEITFSNSVNRTDIWILTETPEVLKTSLWGKATGSGIRKGERRAIGITGESGGRFIFRAIDADKTYYSANGVILESGCTVGFKEGEGPMDFFLEVAYPGGADAAVYPLFAAAL